MIHYQYRVKHSWKISINHKCYSKCYSKFEYKYAHTYTYTETFTHIQTYSHTHIHTKTHICSYKLVLHGAKFCQMAIECGIIKVNAIFKNNMQKVQNSNVTNNVKNAYTVLWIILIQKISSV